MTYYCTLTWLSPAWGACQDGVKKSTLTVFDISEVGVAN
jgi:hypothetical protein